MSSFIIVPHGHHVAHGLHVPNLVSTSSSGCSSGIESKVKMSWAEYLSNLQRDGLKHAAICGLEGANWFLVTEGSNVSHLSALTMTRAELHGKLNL